MQAALRELGSASPEAQADPNVQKAQQDVQAALSALGTLKTNLAAAGLGTTGNGLKLGQVQGRDATHYPLALIVQPGETLQLRLDYRPDLFERADVEAMGRRLIRLLEAAVADAAQPLGRLPILERAERDTILRGWNDTDAAGCRPRPCRRCLPRRLHARRMRLRWCSRTAR